MKKLIMVLGALSIGLLIGIELGTAIMHEKVLRAEQQTYCNTVEYIIVNGGVIELDTCDSYIDTESLQVLLDRNKIELMGFDSSKIGG